MVLLVGDRVQMIDGPTGEKVNGLASTREEHPDYLVLLLLYTQRTSRSHAAGVTVKEQADKEYFTPLENICCKAIILFTQVKRQTFSTSIA